MKKYLLLILSSIILLGSCQKDDLSWKEEIQDLKEEIQSLKLLLNQIKDNVSIVNVTTDDNGYVIEFSDGQIISIRNGQDGQNAPGIIKITENEDEFVFFFSDGTQIACPKMSQTLFLNYGKSSNNRIEVYIPGFTEDSQILWMFEQNLLNNLMTPMACKEIPNDSKNYLDGTTIISQGGTDWISPYIVHAVNNADGDFPSTSTNYFTGGFHGYKQLSAGVSATAKTISVSVYADGMKVNPGSSIEGKTIQIQWENLVQASNTEKEDGTGRCVLEEIVTCTMDFHKRVDVSIETIALEDIDIKKHYALQCSNGGFKGSVTYPPETTYEYDSISHAPAGCKEIQFNNGKYVFSMKSDDDFRYNKSANYNVFYTNVHKGYFSAIMADKDPVRLQQGMSIVFNGTYSVTKL